MLFLVSILTSTQAFAVLGYSECKQEVAAQYRCFTKDNRVVNIDLLKISGDLCPEAIASLLIDGQEDRFPLSLHDFSTNLIVYGPGKIGYAPTGYFDFSAYPRDIQDKRKQLGAVKAQECRLVKR